MEWIFFSTMVRSLIFFPMASHFVSNLHCPPRKNGDRFPFLHLQHFKILPQGLKLHSRRALIFFLHLISYILGSIFATNCFQYGAINCLEEIIFFQVFDFSSFKFYFLSICRFCTYWWHLNSRFNNWPILYWPEKVLHGMF